MSWTFFVKKYYVFLFVVLITYLYIYGPPFRVLPVNISLILCLIPYLLHFFNKNILVLCFSEFKIEIIFLTVIAIYSLVVSVIGGVEYFYHFPFLFGFFYIPMSMWLYLFIKRQLPAACNNEFHNVMSILGVCSIIASVVSIFLFLNPELAHFIKFDILKYDENLLRYQSHRGFGVSDELLFSFSIVQAIICIFYFRVFGINVYSIVLFMLVAISILLNARIGVLFLLFTPIIIGGKNLIKLSVLSFCVVLIYLLLFSDYVVDVPDIKFITSQAEYFFSDLFKLDGNNSGINTIDELIKMVHAPSQLWQLLFGTGANVFLNSSVGSDVGYVLFIYYGGFVFVILLFVFFSFVFFRMYKAGVSKALLIFIFSVIAIAQIKGVFVEAKPGMRLFFLIYVSMIMHGKINRYRTKL